MNEDIPNIIYELQREAYHLKNKAVYLFDLLISSRHSNDQIAEIISLIMYNGQLSELICKKGLKLLEAIERRLARKNLLKHNIQQSAKGASLVDELLKEKN